MQIIRPTLSPYDQMLGRQKQKPGQTYRLMTFVVQQPVDEGTLFYHTMTKALVLLTPEETQQFLADPLSVQELIALWFAVPDSHDDILLSRQLTNVAQMIGKPTKGITNYTIFTTMDCNARCFYCYEKGRPRTPMSEETALRVADYIISNCGGKSVSIEWFGGEPLYNKQVITLICNRLHEAGIKYKSRMISNGYLLDADTIREAKDVWNLKKVQITLDGTEDVYNRCKAFIYRDGSAYRRVISNIHALLEAGIRVSIRLNIDLHNADNLLLLADELHTEFAGQKKLTVYSHPLFGECMEKAAVNQAATRRLIYDKQEQLAERLREYDLASPARLNQTINTGSCMADNDHAITITPTGHIGKCEHFTEEHFIGHIGQEGFDQAEMESFKTLLKATLDTCTHCAYFPMCSTLRQCPDHPTCYPEDQQQHLLHIRQGMMTAYHKFKEEEKAKEGQS